jgi:hypothetical protein
MDDILDVQVLDVERPSRLRCADAPKPRASVRRSVMAMATMVSF